VRAPEAAARPPTWRLGEAVGCFAVGEVAAALAVILAVGFGAAMKSIAVVVAGLLGEWVGYVGGPAFLSRRRGTASLARDFGLRLRGWRDVALGLAVGVGTYVIVLGVIYPPLLTLARHLVGHKVSVGQSAHALGALGRGVGFVAFAVSVTLGAPFAEEVFFRGLLLRGLQHRLGATRGIVVCGLVFGLAHLLGGTEWAAAPALVVFGVVLSVLADRTGRLGPGIVAHMAFNGITVAALAASR
jgi:membrane protease YdiL (CAAX protease family)